MAHFKSGEIINLTAKPITTYTDTGGFITLYPEAMNPQKDESLFFIVEGFQYRILKELGFCDHQLLKASPAELGRDGIKVCMLFTYEKKSVRVMPIGEL